jgi:hypothetical protein
MLPNNIIDIVRFYLNHKYGYEGETHSLYNPDTAVVTIAYNYHANNKKKIITITFTDLLQYYNSYVKTN